MKLAFLGTPDFVVPVLESLQEAHEVVQVITRQDRRRSRRGEPEPSPVKRAATTFGIPVAHRPADVLESGAELGVVVAYGRIIRPSVLEQLPMVNLHLSLLPRWRGAAPVQRAILAGDEETGVCLMQLDDGLDTGPVHGCRSTSIEPEDTAESLTARLIQLGIPLLLEHLDRGSTEPTPQTGPASYADKLAAEDVHLDWSEPAVRCHRRVRVGGAWTSFRAKRLIVSKARLGDASLSPGEMVRIDGEVHVGTSEGSLSLVEVRPEGRRTQDALSWWNGARPEPGERLG